MLAYIDDQVRERLRLRKIRKGRTREMRRLNPLYCFTVYRVSIIISKETFKGTCQMPLRGSPGLHPAGIGCVCDRAHQRVSVKRGQGWEG